MSIMKEYGEITITVTFKELGAIPICTRIILKVTDKQ